MYTPLILPVQCMCVAVNSVHCMKRLTFSVCVPHTISLDPLSRTCGVLMLLWTQFTTSSNSPFACMLSMQHAICIRPSSCTCAILTLLSTQFPSQTCRSLGHCAMQSTTASHTHPATNTSLAPVRSQLWSSALHLCNLFVCHALSSPGHRDMPCHHLPPLRKSAFVCMLAFTNCDYPSHTHRHHLSRFLLVCVCLGECQPTA